ncbi:MAG: peptidoglycan-binding protein [Luteimonas sp.]|nr:peptidoglycan-binding protein [Luteimonas sp.]
MTVQALSRSPFDASAAIPREPQGATYLVQRGDTLSKIAADHHIPLRALQSANPQVLNPDVLYPDQALNLPRDVAAERAPAPALSLAKATKPTLDEGDRGAAVRDLQAGLRKHGFNPGAVDGVFGPRTEAAVRAFQSARGLQVDGVVGPKTWGELGRARPEALVSPNAPTPQLDRGDRGAAVRELQAGLRKGGFDPGAVDGVFGPRTEAAVRAFQSERGLAVDGIVGPRTWAALKGNAPADPPSRPPVDTPPTNPPSSGQGRRDAIVDAAKDIAGDKFRYVWGGGHHARPGASTGMANPNTRADDVRTRGYDCSGFVRAAVYQATGKDSMNGTAATQSARCERISRSELKPGDLIFWRSQRGISHVAIYAGKNSQGVPMMYECAPSYEKRGSSYGTHLTPVSYQGTPSHYGRIP